MNTKIIVKVTRIMQKESTETQQKAIITKESETNVEKMRR